MLSQPVQTRRSVFDESLRNLDEATRLFALKYPPDKRNSSDIKQFKESITQQLEDNLLSQSASSKETAREMMRAFLSRIDVLMM